MNPKRRGNSESRASTSPPPRPPKRLQVSAACNRCREAKTRCSADRPRCKTCASKDLECIYDTLGIEETRQQASVRRQSELEAQIGSYAKLFGLLESSAPERAQAGLQMIRAGSDVQSVLTRLGISEASLSQSAGPFSSPKVDEPVLLVDRHSGLYDRDMSVPTHSNMRRKRRAVPAVSEQTMTSAWRPSVPSPKSTSDRICPFDSMFSRSEPQWSMTLVKDLDQCLNGARLALPFLTDQEQALIPSANSLATLVYGDDLLFRVAGLITCATFPGSHGRQVSQRPNLIWCRDSVLNGLQSRITATGSQVQVLVGVVAALAGWEWVSLVIPPSRI